MANNPSLRTFLDRLTRENEIITIKAEVDPYLELAEIHRRVISEGGPALFFERVKGSRYPVVTNLFGTERRIDLAFGPKPEAFVREMVHIAESILPPKPAELWKHRSVARDLVKLGTRNTSRSPVTQVVDRPARLNELPVLTTWQEDGGPFITLPLVYTEHPVTKKHNLGIYRMQIYDARSAGLHWQIQKGGGFHYHEAERLGQALPVTVFLGGPPALILAAIAPLPEDVPELVLASLLAGRETKDDPQSFGSVRSTGLRQKQNSRWLVMRHRMNDALKDHSAITMVTTRCVTTILSFTLTRSFTGATRSIRRLWSENLARKISSSATTCKSLLSPLFPTVMPSVRDLWTYGETGFHSLCAAVVRERYGREALVSGFRILGEGQLSLTKFLILTDTPQDLKNFPALLEHVLERFRPETDLFVFSNVSMDTLDYTSGKVNEGSKAIMLGLGEPVRKLPRVFQGELPRYVSRAEVFCGGCLVLQGGSFAEDEALASRVASDSVFANWPLIVLARRCEGRAIVAGFLMGHMDQVRTGSGYLRFKHVCATPSPRLQSSDRHRCAHQTRLSG